MPSGERVSRRTIAKRTVGAAAAVWAAPAFTTLALAPAAAASCPSASNCATGASSWVGWPAAARWNNEPITHAAPVTQICLTMTSTVGNSVMMFGLNRDPATNASYNTIDFAFNLLTLGGVTYVYIWESGVFRASLGTLDPGTELCVTRTDPGTVEYSVCGSVVRTRPTPPASDLYVDSSGFGWPSWGGTLNYDVGYC